MTAGGLGSTSNWMSGRGSLVLQRSKLNSTQFVPNLVSFFFQNLIEIVEMVVSMIGIV